MNKWMSLMTQKPVMFGIKSGFDRLGDLHNFWIKLFLFSKDDITLQAHRGSFKTTSLSIAIAIMMVIFPRKKIIFIRKTDDDVKEIIAQVAKLLTMQIYQELSMSLYGVDISFNKISAFEIDTNINQTSSGSSQLLGIGTGSSLTGKHADIVITDDIVNTKDRQSRAERERTKLIYQELQNVKNDGGRIINTGTPWHPDDAFTLMQNGVKSYVYDVYTTGIFTKDEIEKRKRNIEPSLFAANYELRHVASSDLLFTHPVIDDGSRTNNIFDGVCHIDAAYDGKDYSAFTILKEHRDGKIYVYGELYRKRVTDVLPSFERARVQYRAGTLYNEKNADKGFLADHIVKPVKLYHESMNKHIKITTYLKENWENIVFIKGTSRDYINQITDYVDGAEHDDAPDSLASLLREVKNGSGIKVMPKRSLFG